MNNNVLKLEFTGTTLQIKEGMGIWEPQWINGNTNYEVNVAVNLDTNNNGIIENEENIAYDLFNIVLANPKNDKVLELQVAYLLEDGTYRGNFSFPGLLAGETIVHLGIIAKKTGEEDVVVSNPLEIKIVNSIAVPDGFDLSLEEDFKTPDGFLAFSNLITLFSTAKAIKDIRLVDITNENGQLEKNLAVTYIINDDSNPTTQYLGKVNSNLIDLGAQIKRGNNEGGGGKIGASASLIGNKEGFAGGYNTKASAGAAVGKEAKTSTGVAIGRGANSNTKEGKSVAIGYNSSISEDVIASIAIGDYSEIAGSSRSIAIGGSRVKEQKTKVVDSPKSIALGYNTIANKVENGIAIGTEARIKGCDTPKRDQDCIAIGNNAKSTLSGAIALGSLATAGRNTLEDSDIPSGNISDETDKEAFGAIAIGSSAFARRGSSISLGTTSKTYRWGAIAIGDNSVAGKTNSEANVDYKSTKAMDIDMDHDRGGQAIAIGSHAVAKGTNSIAIGYLTKAAERTGVAIGYKAETSAKAAIQLGIGNNSKDKSLQFRDKTIVNSAQELEVHLTKDKIKGALEVEHGGTGATTGHGARANLGFDCGSFEVTIKNGDVYEGNIKFNTSFKKEPIVVLTIKDTTTSVPYRFTAMLDSCDKDKFRYKVQMGPNTSGKNFSGKNPITINWIAMSSYKG